MVNNPLTTPKEIFDRKEQRAIGYFISLAEKMHVDKGCRFSKAIEILQKEHGCYD